ncbi:MAG: hypothetical protein AAFV32_09105 [Myxococcota bacterium]
MLGEPEDTASIQFSTKLDGGPGYYLNAEQLGQSEVAPDRYRESAAAWVQFLLDQYPEDLSGLLEAVARGDSFNEAWSELSARRGDLYRQLNAWVAGRRRPAFARASYAPAFVDVRAMTTTDYLLMRAQLAACSQKKSPSQLTAMIERELTQLLRLEPTNSSALYVLAVMSSTYRQESVRELLLNEPDSVYAWELRVRGLSKSPPYAEVGEALRRHPRDSVLLFFEVDAAKEERDWRRVYETSRRALRVEPWNDRVRRSFVEAAALIGRCDDARRTIQSVLPGCLLDECSDPSATERLVELIDTHCSSDQSMEYEQ